MDILRPVFWVLFWIAAVIILSYLFRGLPLDG